MIVNSSNGDKYCTLTNIANAREESCSQLKCVVVVSDTYHRDLLLEHHEMLA